MCIVIAGDPFWPCHKLAAAILRRLLARCGPDIVAVHSDDTGVAESFAAAARGQRIKAESHLADFTQLGDETVRFRNRAMLRGANLCVILHRSLLDAGKAITGWRESYAPGQRTLNTRGGHPTDTQTDTQKGRN